MGPEDRPEGPHEECDRQMHAAAKEINLLKAHLSKEQRLYAETAAKLDIAENALYETWLDPEGHSPDAFRVPTAEAYGRACLALRDERTEVLRLRSLLSRYLGLVRDEEGYDYLDSDWSGRFTDAEAAELRAMMAARPQR